MKHIKELTVVLIVFLSATTALADVKINETNFPDENFRNWLLTQTYSGADGILTDKEIAEVSRIEVFGQNIKSLKGIEYFTELRYMSCSENQLAELDVSRNTKLTTLNCADNLLTSLDVSKNTALETLFCAYNQLTSLEVSGCVKLQDLVCSINLLSSLNVSECTELTSIYCNDNQLSSLDVSGYTKLQDLECENN